jgi:hypothetical protein
VQLELDQLLYELQGLNIASAHLLDLKGPLALFFLLIFESRFDRYYCARNQTILFAVSVAE